MTSLDSSFYQFANSFLSSVDRTLATKYRGDFGGRQPIHTCYVPADRLTANSPADWGNLAIEMLEEHSPTPHHFAKITGANQELVEEVFERAGHKLVAEPIEDLRIDFEDGYGRRGDDEEDDHLDAALEAFGSLRAPFKGIRIKSMEQITRDRGLRTLDRFVNGIIKNGTYQDDFIITLPKVTFGDQVEFMVQALEQIEKSNGLTSGTIKFEIQIETTQAIIGPDGALTAAGFLDRAGGRLTAFHFGTYDYSAAAGISAAYQTLDHPAADFAKTALQVVVGGTTVRLSDGSTNILPIGTTLEVHAAMHNHYRLVRRALERGFYQGWDLHGTQLPTRILANWIFYREGLQSAATRLRNYLDKAESGTMDEPATALVLARYFMRGLDCGAIESSEVQALANQSENDLRTLIANKGVVR